MSRGRGKKKKAAETLQTARGPVEHKIDGEPQGILLDPFELNTMSDYVQSMGGSTPTGRGALREIARAPWIQAIHGTRQNQVSEFASARENDYDLGFSIELVNGEDSMSKADMKEANRIRDLLLTCGDDRDDYDAYTRDDFDAFLRKTVDDSLTLDAYAWEIVPDRSGQPAFWHVLDAATMYRCAPRNTMGKYGPEDAAYCQVVDARPQRYWPADEIAYGIRRPRTELKSMGYGRPELYDLTYIVQTMLSGWYYNLNVYKNGGMRGILAIMGAITAEQLRLFKRKLLYQSQGVANAHKMTVVNPADGSDVKWIPLEGMTPKDLEFGNLINAAFLLSCAVYSIDPSEVGFYMNSGSTGGSGPLFESSQESKLKAGRDKGLRPLLRHIESKLNRHIVSRLGNGRFRVRFLGMDSMSQTERIEYDMKRLQAGLTIPEWRQERDLPKLDFTDPEKAMENIILNPTYMQWLQFYVANMAQQGQDEGAIQMGEPGADEGAPDEGAPDEGADEEQSQAPEQPEKPDRAEPAASEGEDFVPEGKPETAKSMTFEVFA